MLIFFSSLFIIISIQKILSVDVLSYSFWLEKKPLKCECHEGLESNLVGQPGS